jgi:hypothetical protein
MYPSLPPKRVLGIGGTDVLKKQKAHDLDEPESSTEQISSKSPSKKKRNVGAKLMQTEHSHSTDNMMAIMSGQKRKNTKIL